MQRFRTKKMRSEGDGGGNPPGVNTPTPGGVNNPGVNNPPEENNSFLSFKTAEDFENYKNKLINDSFNNGKTAMQEEYKLELEKAQKEKIETERSEKVNEIKNNKFLFETLKGTEGWENSSLETLSTYERIFDNKQRSITSNPEGAPPRTSSSPETSQDWTKLFTQGYNKSKGDK